MSRKRNRKRAASSPSSASSAEGRSAVASRPSFREFGGTGLKLSGGLVAGEYNPDLQGLKLYEEFDRMQRGESQVQGIELVIGLPVKSVSYEVRPHRAGEPIDLEIAERLHDNLFSGMTSPWGSVITEAIEAVMIGMNFLEKVWEVRDGATLLQKLAPRHPATIKELQLDANGGLQGIVQRLTNPVTRQSEDRPIEIDALLRFSFREKRGDISGRPLLRPIRTAWFFKQALLKIGGIGLERFAIPSLWGQLPSGYTASDKQEYAALLESVRVAARGYGLLPPGYEKPQLLEGGQRLPDILRWIQYLDQLMARGALAQFLNLGSGDTGSFALSDSHVELFLLALEDIANWICEIISRYLIPQWVGFNYVGFNRFPTLGHSPIARLLQRTALLNTLTALVQSQIVTRGDDIEDLARNMLGLAPLSEADQSAPSEETIPQEEPGQGSTRYDRLLRALNRGETLTDAEWASLRGRSLHSPRLCGEGRPAVAVSSPSSAQSADRRSNRPGARSDFDATHARLAAARSKFIADMKRLLERQHAALVKKLEPIIQDFRNADDLTKGNHIKRMRQVEVPLQGEYAKAVAEWQRQFYTTAREEAAKAAGLEPPATISNALRTHMAVKADVIAQKHAEALRAAVLLQVLESLRRELPAKQLSWNLTQIARKRSSLDLREDFVAAGEELVELLNSELATLEIPEAV